MLARFQTLDRLVRVHLCWRTKNRRIDARLLERLGEICAGVRNSVLLGDCLRRLERSTNHGYTLSAINILDSIQMLFAERASACQYNLHKIPLAFVL